MNISIYIHNILSKSFVCKAWHRKRIESGLVLWRQTGFDVHLIVKNTSGCTSVLYNCFMSLPHDIKNAIYLSLFIVLAIGQNKHIAILTKGFHHWASYKESCSLIKFFIFSLIENSVSGLSPRWGSAPAAQRAITASRWFSNAAQNRGDLLPPATTLTLALASSRTGTAAGFNSAAKWRAVFWEIIGEWQLWRRMYFERYEFKMRMNPY